MYEYDLLSVNEMEDIRAKSKRLDDFPIVKSKIKFSSLNGSTFLEYIKKLQKLNDQSIYIWTNNANGLGLYRADSLSAITWGFPFEINEGIIVFIASDLEDKLIFDFFLDEKNNELVEIEAQGKNWSKVSSIGAL